MPLMIQVSEDELMAKVGRLTVQAEGLQQLLERCAAVMTPEQLQQAGIRQREQPEQAIPRIEDLLGPGQVVEVAGEVPAVANGALEGE